MVAVLQVHRNYPHFVHLHFLFLVIDFFELLGERYYFYRSELFYFNKNNKKVNNLFKLSRWLGSWFCFRFIWFRFSFTFLLGHSALGFVCRCFFLPHWCRHHYRKFSRWWSRLFTVSIAKNSFIITGGYDLKDSNLSDWSSSLSDSDSDWPVWFRSGCSASDSRRTFFAYGYKNRNLMLIERPDRGSERSPL